MKQPTTNRNSTDEKNTHRDFHGASIIANSGTEIPITEEMLQESFKVLIDAWEQSRKKMQT